MLSMGKSIIFMVNFNSYVKLPKGMKYFLFIYVCIDIIYIYMYEEYP